TRPPGMKSHDFLIKSSVLLRRTIDAEWFAHLARQNIETKVIDAGFEHCANLGWVEVRQRRKPLVKHCMNRRPSDQYIKRRLLSRRLTNGVQIVFRPGNDPPRVGRDLHLLPGRYEHDAADRLRKHDTQMLEPAGHRRVIGWRAQPRTTI